MLATAQPAPHLDSLGAVIDPEAQSRLRISQKSTPHGSYYVAEGSFGNYSRTEFLNADSSYGTSGYIDVSTIMRSYADELL